MTNKLTALLVALLITILFSGFYKSEHKPSNGIKFKQLTSTIKTDTSATIEVLVDNGEREQTINLDCIISSDSLRFIGAVLPNDRNVTINYRASIKLQIKQ